jgi:hypothetical protein
VGSPTAAKEPSTARYCSSNHPLTSGSSGGDRNWELVVKMKKTKGNRCRVVMLIVEIEVDAFYRKELSHSPDTFGVPLCLAWLGAQAAAILGSGMCLTLCR